MNPESGGFPLCLSVCSELTGFASGEGKIVCLGNVWSGDLGLPPNNLNLFNNTKSCHLLNPHVWPAK